MIPITKLSLPAYKEIAGDIRTILKTQRLTMGPYQKMLEERFARTVDVNNAVTVNSCTDGLTIAMKALGLKGEVIVPSFTYVATVHSIVHAGLTPRFVDIDRNSFNLSAEKVREELEDREFNISAILPVHIFGQPCEIEELWKVAKEYDIPIIWDSAHCGGYSQYKLRKIGGYHTVEVCSLAPTKLITAGEGGIITTENDELAEKCRRLSRLGLPQNLDFQGDERIFTDVGYNARIPEINCALALRCLDHSEQWGDAREKLVNIYRSELEGTTLRFQKSEKYLKSANFTFPVVVEDLTITRDKLQAELAKKGIQSRKIWFCPPVHKMPCYKKYNHIALPNTEELSDHILALPLWSEMPEKTVLKVCSAIKKILRTPK